MKEYDISKISQSLVNCKSSKKIELALRDIRASSFGHGWKAGVKRATIDSANFVEFHCWPVELECKICECGHIPLKEISNELKKMHS